ncbi:MAG: DinB family protein [Vicinamibacterales bacterium]|nr:DinB family protein [Vicinamibacterales bacterium]
MHPHVVDVFQQLDEARLKLRAAVDTVPAPLRGKRPGDDRWSVNEILEHLSLVEQRFAGLIAMRIAEAAQSDVGVEQETRDPFPTRLRQMFADRANRRSAPEAVHPTGSLGDEAAWAAVERARVMTRDIVSAADGLALSRIVHNHPVFGTLSVYQLVELIANHEVRHSKQIAGIGEEFV